MSNKFSDPFAPTVKKTERTANQKIVEWMNQAIKAENLRFGFAEQETSGKDRKQPDIIVFKAPRSTEVSLVLELKPPYFDPLDFESVKEPARLKAVRRRAPYFATSNCKSLYLFSTERANRLARDEQQLVQKYSLSDIEDFNLIDEPIYKNSIIKNLTIFLRDLEGFVYGKEPESLLPIDEVMISILQEKVQVLSFYYLPLIEQQVIENLPFRKKLRGWFNEQGWSFIPQREHYLRASRQTAYLLISKILFYDVLRATDPQNFAQLTIPDDFTKGGMIAGHLQNYFSEILKIDYETIYSTDFIDEVAFPDDKNVIYHIRELINRLNRFDFSKIEFEILGRIFEGLIPPKERHVLGQYFTQPDIVDLILGFAIRDEKDVIFDPACGAGTFLRRAYHLKRLINPNLAHESLLPTLWGSDIAKFPASLSTLNLAIADLKSKKNYPRVIQKDFFEWTPGHVDLPDNTRKVFLKSLGDVDKETLVPRYFDAIVGNPPYTRQEEMDDLVDKGQEYKENLIDRAVKDEAGRRYALLSKRAGLHAYFFVHATKFLKNGGRFGFIVSNSWMDVDYGAGLQEHFLKHYRIKAVIESKVERWFADADVNTCLVFLEKCGGENGKEKTAREENLVRFVYLKKPLSEFIPPASRIFEETVERKAAVEKLLRYFESKTSFFENDDLRVYCKVQKELWEEGWDEETRRYTGGKWGKYIRAPEIFFKILEKTKDKLILFGKVAQVKRGMTTGANEWFYLTEKEIIRRQIEKEFWMHQNKKGDWIPNYVIKSPRECPKLVVDPRGLKYRVLMIHKDRRELRRTRILDYIKEGEEKGYHKRPTCASRKNWWDLCPGILTRIAWVKSVNDRYINVLSEKPVFVDQRFYAIYPKRAENDEYLLLYLNSFFLFLLKEVDGRVGLGEGALDTAVYEIPKYLIPNLDRSEIKIRNRIHGFLISKGDYKIASVYEETGGKKARDIDLETVKSDRIELDRIIMGDILNLTDSEQLEVYKAVVDLVKSRLDKAKSVKNHHKSRQGVDVSLLVKTIVGRIGGNSLGAFYKKEVLSHQDLKTIPLPEYDPSLEINPTLLGFRLVSGQASLDFDNEEEAEYGRIFCKARWPEIKIPKDKEVLAKIILPLKKIEDKAEEAITYYTEGLLERKLQNEVDRLVWQKISGYGKRE